MAEMLHSEDIQEVLESPKWIRRMKRLRLSQVEIDVDYCRNYEFSFTHDRVSRLHAIVPISDFPECCGIAVISSLFVDVRCRNLGLGRFFLELVVEAYRQTISKVYISPGILLAATADRHESIYQVYGERILRRGRWKQLQGFTNPITRHNVILWSKDLTK